jgi:hypothetical protein
LSNIEDITDPDLKELKSEAKNGFLFGAYGKLRLTERFAFQPEIYYAKKNTKYSSVTTTQTGSIHTWDIPLLANLTVLDLKIAKVYGVAGPVVSYISNAKFSDFDITEKDFKSGNWTFQAGGGIEVWKLTADVRYEWGLKDISDLKTANIGQKTNVLTFTLGYKLFGL